MADLLTKLEAEHRQVSSWLDKLEVSEDLGERLDLLAKVETALQRHMAVEERDVYPLLAELDDEMAEEANNEHEGARELLIKVHEMAPDVPGFGGAVAALKGAITHHVEDEESQAFPKLRKEKASAIAALPVTGGGASAGGMTRDELYQRAKELDIDGRSQMSKAELATAVHAAAPNAR